MPLIPVALARDRLAFHPDPVQSAVLASRARNVILNCTRQWGKSTVTAAHAVFTAWHEPESSSSSAPRPASPLS